MAIRYLSGQTIDGTLTVSGNVQGATFNGFAINSTGTNNVANQIVRTESNGYVNFGWINSVSGNHTGSITRITASNDAYLRYVTPAQFRTGVTDGFYAPSSTVSGVTSVATGNGLTGGTIISTGTLSMSGSYTGNFSVTGTGSRLTVNKTKSGTGVENYDLIRLGLLGTGAVSDSSTIGWFSTTGTKTAGIEGISGLDNILYGELAFHVRRYTTDSYDRVMTINNRGNVGIGDATPTSKLTILGTSTAASNTPSNAIVDVHSTSTAHLLMGVANVSPYGAWINTDGIAQPLVLMGTGGNVGIGTIAPNATLDVHAPSTTAPSLAMGAAAGQVFKNEDSELAFGLQNQGPYNVWMQSRFNGNVSRPLLINPLGGNIGIGLTSPGRELDVLGVIRAQGPFHSVVSSTSTNLATASGGQLNLFNSSSTDGNFSNIGGYNSNSLVTSQINFINVSHTSRTGAITFNTHNGGSMPERMRVWSGGMIQIGGDVTATPELLTLQAYTQNQAFSGKYSAAGYLWFLRNETGPSGRFQLMNAGSTTINLEGNTTRDNYILGDLGIGTDSPTNGKLDVRGRLLVNGTGTTDGFGSEQTLTIKKVLGNNGVATVVAVVGHTHALQITAVVYQTGSSGCAATGSSTKYYGYGTTGFNQVASAGVGAVTNISLGYLNTNSAGTDYVLTVTPTFTSGSPPTCYLTIRGQSDQYMVVYTT